MEEGLFVKRTRCVDGSLGKIQSQELMCRRDHTAHHRFNPRLVRDIHKLIPHDYSTFVQNPVI